MAYDCGFSEEFWTGEEYSLDGPYPETSETPESVLQALLSLSTEDLEFIRTELKIDVDTPYDATVAEIMGRARDVDTCTDLQSPVEVWLDPQGWLTIHVH